MTKRWRMWGIFFAVLCLAEPAAAGTTLVLQNGKSIDVDGQVIFDGRAFTLPGGQRFNRDAVTEIDVGALHTPGASTWSYDRERYEKLFAKGRAMAARHPNRDGVILEDLGVFRLEADGNNSYRYRFSGLVVKDDAKHWGQVEWGFDTTRQRLEGPYGVVIHPDGSFAIAGDADRKTISPYHGAQFFDRYEVTTLTIPDVRVGDIVEYWYTSEEFRPPDPDFFFPSYLFQSPEPVLRSRIEIRIPPGKQLYYETKNMPAEQAQPAIRRDADGGQTYVWEMDDVPPFDAERAMPAYPEVVASMRATVLPNWNKIFDRLSEFYRTRMIATDAVKAATAAAIGDATPVEDKIARIYQYVQRKIRYISIKTDVATDFTGHPAEVTLANGYGDCTDKAILLATMLGVVGVEAHPIILQTFGGRRDQYAIPNVGGDHAIDAVFLNGRRFFLDGTAETYKYPAFRFDDYGRPYVDALGRTVGFIDRPPPGADSVRQEFSLTFDDRGAIRGARVSEVTGGLEAMTRQELEGVDPKERKTSLQQQLLGYGANARLVDYKDENVNEMSKPLHMTVAFTADRVAKPVGDLWLIDLPGLPSRNNAIDLDARKTDMLSPLNIGAHAVYRVTLPAGWRIADLPAPLKIDNRWMYFDGRYEKTADGFVLRYDIVDRAAEVMPADYPAVRANVIEVETFFGRRAFAREATR
jgi:transglutaminase-like putative cysteine protease